MTCLVEIWVLNQLNHFNLFKVQKTENYPVLVLNIMN